MIGLNRYFTYMDMGFLDCTPLLADSIRQLLQRGHVFQHTLMTVVATREGKSFYDPVSMNLRALPAAAIYQRDSVGDGWKKIGATHQLDDLAIHLANATPVGCRYGLWVDVLERLEPMGHSLGQASVEDKRSTLSAYEATI